MGRATRGVRGIRLRGDDNVAGLLKSIQIKSSNDYRRRPRKTSLL